MDSSSSTLGETRWRRRSWVRWQAGSGRFKIDGPVDPQMAPNTCLPPWALVMAMSALTLATLTGFPNRL
jgi:hypothetical protein